VITKFTKNQQKCRFKYNSNKPIFSQELQKWQLIQKDFVFFFLSKRKFGISDQDEPFCPQLTIGFEAQEKRFLKMPLLIYVVWTKKKARTKMNTRRVDARWVFLWGQWFGDPMLREMITLKKKWDVTDMAHDKCFSLYARTLLSMRRHWYGLW